MWLSDYLFKKKTIISTRNFAVLLDMMAFAKEEGVYTYDSKLTHKLKQLFIDDMAENDTFSASDLCKVFTSMEQLEPTWSKDQFHTQV